MLRHKKAGDYEADQQTDIVIHVNKLKEGWDVTNLYMIVPLRASASEILTEQTLGCGLRLPYVTRVATGEFEEFAAVDRLTVIAHDRFDEIIQRAKEPGSVVQVPTQTLVIGEGGDIPLSGTTLIETPSVGDMILTGAQPHIPGFAETPQQKLIFETPEEVQAAVAAVQVIQRFERRVGSLEDLRTEKVQKAIVDEVREQTQTLQPALEGVAKSPDLNKVVAVVTQTVVEKTIPIPKIVVLPKKQVTFSFGDFDLAGLETINYRPISDELLIENLRTGARISPARSINVQYEMRPEDYIVSPLIERDEIAYEDHSDLIYKLARQVVGLLRSYLDTDMQVENVLIAHGRTLADFIFYGETVRLAREAAPAAIRRLIELMGSPDERVASVACNAILDRAFGKPREYDPSKEEKAERPKFDPALLTPAELDRVEKALRPRVRASRQPEGTAGEGDTAWRQPVAPMRSAYPHSWHVISCRHTRAGCSRYVAWIETGRAASIGGTEGC